MALPTPNLDDLRFQTLVDEARRRIPQLCPAWTDFNLSDPGITLIELFAWMTELITYRLNKVPEKNYIKFLEMLGVQLQPARAARIELTFRLSTPFPLRPDDPYDQNTAVIPQNLLVSTGATADEEAEVVFSTDETLTIIPPLLRQVRRDIDFQVNYYQDGRLRECIIFGPGQPHANASFYLGFDERNHIAGHVLRLHFACEKNRGVGVRRDQPPVLWECFGGRDKDGKEVWIPVEQGLSGEDRDTTGGFNNEHGSVTLYLPLQMQSGTLREERRKGEPVFWLRCRYVEDKDEPTNRYSHSPEVRQIYAEVVGATTTATNAVCVEIEELGVSTGEPGQSFTLAHDQIVTPPVASPVAPMTSALLRLAPTEVATTAVRTVAADGAILNFTDYWQEDGAIQEVLEVEEIHNGHTVFEQWRPVADFAHSSAHDRHFLLDRAAATVQLGPAIRMNDGTIRQHGRIPPVGRRIRIRRYWYSGGAHGNLPINTINVMHAAVPYVDSVTNRKPALGGAAVETLDAAMLRARKAMRTQQRAVSTHDYETLVLAAHPDIARVKCLGPARDEEAPNVLRLLVVPKVAEAVWQQQLASLSLPSALRTAIQADLEPYRLLTVRLHVAEPRYVGVSVYARVVPAHGLDPKTLAMRVQQVLTQIITPLKVATSPYAIPLLLNPAWDGWPFGQDLFIAELFSLIQQIVGVKHVLAVKLGYQVLDLDKLTEEQLPEANDPVVAVPWAQRHDLQMVQENRLAVAPDTLLYSLSHEIDVNLL